MGPKQKKKKTCDSWKPWHSCWKLIEYKKNMVAVCVPEVAQQSLLGIQQREFISTAYDVKYWAE